MDWRNTNFRLPFIQQLNEIITVCPQLSTESACELEATAFNSSTTMIEYIEKIQGTLLRLESCLRLQQQQQQVTGRVFSQGCPVIGYREYPAHPVQFQMNTSNHSMVFHQPQSSHLSPLISQVQWLQRQQQNYDIPVGRSNNIAQPSLGAAPYLLSSIPANHMIPSSSVVTTVAIATPVFSTLHSSSYTYSQTTTVDTIMTTVQCGNSSQHRSLYSVCDPPTSVALVQEDSTQSPHFNQSKYADTDGYSVSKHYDCYTHFGLQSINTSNQTNNSTHSIICQQPQQLFTFKHEVPSQQLQKKIFSSSNDENKMEISSFSIPPYQILSTVISSVNVSSLSQSQASVPVYSVASQSTIPLATSQQRSCSVSRPARSIEVFQNHYVELMILLPMSDDIFLGKLYTNNLLPNNIKAVIESLPTPVEKTSKFLDNVIKPSVENNIITRFKVLLAVIMNSDDDPLVELAERINLKLNWDCFQSEKGVITIGSDNAHSNHHILVTKPPVFYVLHDSICDTYKETRYTPVEAEWPPNQPNSIVNVALIHYKGKRTRQELFEIAQRHKDGSTGIDQLLLSNNQVLPSKKQRLDNSRITKDIADIFKADSVDQTENSTVVNNPPKRILIEGAPGIGKTVLAKEIAYRWANKEILQHRELILLIYLRDPRLREVKSIKNLVKLFTSTKIAKDVADYIQECNGSGVAFVIDGFDEYPSSLQHSSFIVDIISGKTLHKAMVVVTSRPTATVSLHNRVHRRIDILGFAKEEREKYITQSLSDCPEKKVGLFKYLKRQPTINAFCYVPLHLAVLLYLFQQGGKLPETLTEMNESFIIHTVYRYLRRHKLKSLGVISKISNLPEPVLNVIIKISQVAFKGLQENQLVFTLDEIKGMCPDINETPGAINGFGLLQAVQHYPQEGAGETASFNFLHYTMQEFLAAFHVSTLSDKEQSSLMKETFWSERFNFMWMMYVGILGIQSKLFDDFVSKGKASENNKGIELSHEILKDKRKRLHVFQCYAEANGKVKVPSIIASMFKNGKVKINDVTLLPNHISSLVSFLSHSLSQLKILNLKNCNCGDIGMNNIEQYIADSKEETSMLEYVDLTGNNSSPWNVYCAVIKQCSVSHLTLCGDHGMEEFTKTIEDSLLTNTSLQLLTLREISNTGLSIIKMFLFHNKLFYFNELNISNKETDGSYVLLQTKFAVNDKIIDRYVSRAVTVNILWDKANDSSPDSINLSGQCKGDSVFFIAFGLCNNYCRIIRILDISGNKINDLGAKAIAEGLHENRTMQKLDISNNNILDDGTKAISDFIKKSSTLQHLSISGNEISAEGAKHIAEAIKITKTVQKLDISSNKISNIGAISIGDSLEDNKSLLELNLSENQITDVAIKGLCKAFRINKVLLKLNISKNWITAEGILNFLVAISDKNVLQFLNITYNNVTKLGLLKIKECIKGLSFPLQINLSWNEMKDENFAILKSTITCLLHKGQNDTIESNESEEKEWPLDYISGVEYRTAFLIDCLKEDNNLQRLNFYKTSNNQSICIDNVKMIAKTIQVLTTLQELDLSGNGMSNGEVGVISDSVKNSKSLKELNLGQNNISDEGANRISEFIKMTTTLQKLNLFHNYISNDGVAAISDSIKSNSSLQELNIEMNNINCQGAKAISEAIKITKTLRILNLCSNKISDDGAADISDSIKINWSLQQLNLGNNDITDTEAKKIAESIQVTTVLQKLDLRGNKISVDGVAAICNSLKINSSLLELNLRFINSITCKEISEVIQVTTTLQTLNLCSNKIYDKGVATICSSVMINKSLKELNLGYNSISDKGATKIAEVIKVNKILQILSLCGNTISDKGAIAISDSLKVNRSLQELDLQWNSITDKGAKYFAGTIQVTKTLRKLNLSNNNVSDDGAAAISSIVQNEDTIVFIKERQFQETLK